MPTMWEWLEPVWPVLLTAVALGADILAVTHVLLYRRDPRAALLWIGLIWLTPLLGAILYSIFGINRIRRRAKELRSDLERIRVSAGQHPVPPEELARRLPGERRYLTELERLVERVVSRRLLAGNRIEPLENGDRAYPAMLEAIGQARTSVSLTSYIFDSDVVGRRFVEALSRAAGRGVAVRVLVDDAGSHYSFPRITRLLRQAGVITARFHPRLRLLPRSVLNMRNHRKLCVIDGTIGFTGGLNIRAANLLADRPRHPTRDLHFRIRGPTVAQLQAVFAEDWLFTTGERLGGETWFPRLEAAGPALARGIPDGPDEDYDKLRWVLLGAVGIARTSIQIVTPYFLPDASLTSALNLAALRGVAVEIFLPARSNLPIIDWAMHATLWQVLEHGCRVWFTRPPFDHTKLLLVDGYWSFFGSANWDHRSLRLNFEFNVECLDRELARELEVFIERRRSEGRPVSLEEMDSRSLPVRLRDGVARLFTPLL
ncbi:MAG: phospholipase D-like domain-containing protein [Planctomycetota bacterium]